MSCINKKIDLLNSAKLPKMFPTSQQKKKKVKNCFPIVSKVIDTLGLRIEGIT
jgi:hypothetical protein